MRNIALANICDDLHITVRVRRETSARRDVVVIPDIQVAERLVRRINMATDMEVVQRFQPAKVFAPELGEWAIFNHDRPPQNG